MAAELPKPGVEVVQVIRTVTPSVVTPTLVPCIVGVAKQVVELLETNGAGASQLNGDALVVLPAFFIASAGTGSPPAYAGLHGLNLVVSINNAPNVSITFSDPNTTGLSPASAVSQVTAALLAAGVSSARAEVVGTTQWRLRTVATGEFQTIYVDPSTSATVLSAFGIGAAKTYQGVGGYNQFETVIPPTNYPDPRGNLEELVIEPSSVRVFLASSSTNFAEVQRSEAFLRLGSVAVAATVIGSVTLSTLTYASGVLGKILNITIDGGTAQVITITAGATSASAFIADINSQLSGAEASDDGTGRLQITSNTTGASSSIAIGTGNLNVVVGLTSSSTTTGTSIAVIDDGNGDNFSSLISFSGYDFTAAALAASVTGNVSMAGLTYPADLADKTLTISDGQIAQTVTFSASIANMAAVLTAINGVMGTASGGRITATASGGNFLVLTHSRLGTDGMIDIVGGTAVTTLGLTTGITHGTRGVVFAGDELFIDGVSAGVITAVAPGAATSVLKVNNQKPISSNIGSYWHIIAKNLTGSGSRPLPQLSVDANGTARVKFGVLRDTNGNMVNPTQARAPIYVSYTAVRKDLSPSARQAGLVRIDNQTMLESIMSPIDTTNPLALGMFFALVNAPGVQITGLGVDAVSADAPFGTPEAFNRAAEFLEAFEVYAIAPLTHDSTVAQIFNTHVNFMSEPSQKGERIVLHNSEQPTHEIDELVASGADGNTVGSGGLSFDTGIPNLSALLLNKDVNPVGTIPTSAGVFLDIASDALNYSVSAISGSVVTVRVSFDVGTNDDAFYATTALNVAPLPSQLVQEAFAVRIRGAALVNSDNTPDKQSIAETYAAVSQSYLNRRFWHTAPDTVAATLGGLEQSINGFYMNAGIAGMIGQQPPQQSFTNFPMAGFTRVIGSTNYFSERQMNIMAAGGTYIVIQEAPSAPLIARMALTTDLTSVETRTDSITKVVDFTAKFLRRSLKNFIGRFNITQAFLDQLGTVISGVGGYLVEAGILVGFNLNNIVQDEDAPDTVLIDVLIDVPYPANYIRITLVI
jgi:hypothetical protein